MNTIRQITVVGAGLMGHGIALDFALAGHDVNLQDVDAQRLQQAAARIRATVEMLAAGGVVAPEAVSAIIGRVHGVASLKEAATNADLAIESVFEDLAVKRALLGELDQVCPAHTILATNTSSFPPSALADATRRLDKVIGAHYFNPPFLLPLVEVIRGTATSEETTAALCELLTQCGKKPVVLKREAPGFVANRLQAALIREAMAIVDRGIADPQDVDDILRYGFARRLAVAGLFEILDLAGLDLAHAVARHLLPDLESSSELPDLLRTKVERGELGAKTGQGFYPWTPESATARNRTIAQALLGLARLAKAPPGAPRPRPDFT